MVASLTDLFESRLSAVRQARRILDQADAERRPLSGPERERYDRIDSDIDRLGLMIEEGRMAHARTSAWANSAPEWLSAIPAGTPAHNRLQESYRAAFVKYLTSGSETGDHSLGLQVAADYRGGVMAPTHFTAMVCKFLDDNLWVRQLATVLPPVPTAKSIGVPGWDIDPDDGEWTPEVPTSELSDNDSARNSKREFCPHQVVRFIKVSKKLMLSGMVGIDAFLAGRLGQRCKVAEEKAFLTGDGSQKPLGIFTASVDGISTARDVVCASATAFTADEVIALLFNLKAQYHANATLVTSREFIKRCRLLRDGSGAYLWQPGLAAGTPDTILGKGYRMSEFAPNTFTAGQYLAVWGDFKAGYWIQDSLEVEVQVLVERLALRNQNGLVCRKEVDGAPVVEEAFSRLKLAA